MTGKLGRAGWGGEWSILQFTFPRRPWLTGLRSDPIYPFEEGNRVVGV